MSNISTSVEGIAMASRGFRQSPLSPFRLLRSYPHHRLQVLRQASTSGSAPGLFREREKEERRKKDERWMHLALAQAAEAYRKGEVPIGAIVVREGDWEGGDDFSADEFAAKEMGALIERPRVLAEAHNMMEELRDPTAHAEMLAIRRAADLLKQEGGITGQSDWRELRHCTLYVTIEPCCMCAGACLQCRMGRVVYGARSPLLGAHGSWRTVLPLTEEEEFIGTTMTLPGDGCSVSSNGNDGVSACGIEDLTGRNNRLWLRPHATSPETQVSSGILAEECGELMKSFFKEKSRGRNQQAKFQIKCGG